MRGFGPLAAPFIRLANWRGALAAAGIAAVAILTLSPTGASAQESGVSREYSLKAVFLYNFAKFTEWPRGATGERGDGNFTICVLGKNPFGSLLEEIASKKKVKGRKMAIRRLDELENLESCQILFAGKTESAPPEAISEAADGLSLLIVGETKGFANRGGIVNFIIVDDAIKFEINMAAAKKAGLSLSADLLSLAKIIDGAK